MTNETQWLRILLKMLFYAFFLVGLCIGAIVTVAVLYSLFVRNLFQHDLMFGEKITTCALLAIFWFVFYDAYRHFKSWKL